MYSGGSIQKGEEGISITLFPKQPISGVVKRRSYERKCLRELSGTPFNSQRNKLRRKGEKKKTLIFG